MRKSKELDNIMDECLERLLAKGETIEQCLRSFPEHASELKPLLETALAINNEISSIQPSPEVRDKARYQFHSALQGIEQKRSRSFFSMQPGWATTIAIVLAIVLVGGGTVAAAGGSMPDNPLYSVKLATEQVQLALTPSSLGKAELYAKLADRRVTEIASMADESKPEKIEQATQRLDAYLTRIADLASIQETRGWLMTSKEAATLPDTTVPAPPGVRETPTVEVTPAPTVVEPAPPVEEAPLLAELSRDGAQTNIDPRTKLKATVERQAFDNTAQLRALLETAPPSAVPALERAITVSETGYEKALKALE